MAPMELNPHSNKLSTKKIGDFHQRLMAWYGEHGRHHLPWRQTDDAYRILVSEVMLQQTQVETVLGRFYQPFLRRFPTLKALAAAEQSEVMHAWQGLGYYRRAGYLYQTARQCGGDLPKDYVSLIALLGIGKNTAHAILAFAHHQPYAIMEANVKRIVSRIFAMEKPTDAALWQAAETLLNHAEPFHHNQAMMDLGSMICTAKNPRCTECPAKLICTGKAEPERYPKKKHKKTVPVRRRHIVIVEDEHGNIYATPRSGNLLGGLYQFIEMGEGIETLVLNDAIYPHRVWGHIGNITQKYSHFILEGCVYTVRFSGEHSSEYWHSPEQLRHLPCSNAEKKILDLMGV